MVWNGFLGGHNGLVNSIPNQILKYPTNLVFFNFVAVTLIQEEDTMSPPKGNQENFGDNLQQFQSGLTRPCQPTMDLVIQLKLCSEKKKSFLLKFLSKDFTF